MTAFLIERPRCVFIRIPKTGSTSIIRGPFSDVARGPVHGEFPAAWRDEASFAFVRNPFDRLVSVWRMFRHYPVESGRDTRIRDGLTLADVMEIMQNEHLELTGTSYLSKLRRHAIPLHHPFNGLEHARQVGRFERFEADLKAIARQLDFDLPEIPHLRQSDRRHYSRYYDDRTRELAAAAYAEDVSGLDYRFEEP